MNTRHNDANVNCESLNVKNMYIMSITLRLDGVMTPISDINCSDLVPQAVQLHFRLVIHAEIFRPGVIRLLISVNMLQLLGNDARKSPASVTTWTCTVKDEVPKCALLFFLCAFREQVFHTCSCLVHSYVMTS